jgi:hypothetical protein
MIVSDRGRPGADCCRVRGRRAAAVVAEAPYLLAAEGERVILAANVLAEAECPLVGTAKENGVIDPEVLWVCINRVALGGRDFRRRPVGLIAAMR